MVLLEENEGKIYFGAYLHENENSYEESSYEDWVYFSTIYMMEITKIVLTFILMVKIIILCEKYALKGLHAVVSNFVPILCLN